VLSPLLDAGKLNLASVLWRARLDTQRIAKMLRVSEAVIWNAMDEIKDLAASSPHKRVL
jgi:hypothetical protein